MIILSNVSVFLLLADFSLYLFHNHSLHTDIITTMDFRGEREKDREKERERGGLRRKKKGSLFSIFSLIRISIFLSGDQTTQWEGEKALSPLFLFPYCSIHFPPFFFTGFSLVSKCQTNKPRNKIPLPPSLLLKQTACSVL